MLKYTVYLIFNLFRMYILVYENEKNVHQVAHVNGTKTFIGKYLALVLIT